MMKKWRRQVYLKQSKVNEEEDEAGTTKPEKIVVGVD